ncbi:MAG: hypothetical protein ACREN8_04710 [Candidatus Dormibacteraceae bacterium]
MQRLAALDVGSNTTHILLCEVGCQGELTEIGDWVEMTELGVLVEQFGQLGQSGEQRVQATLERILARAREVGFDQLVAGATEAVRKASDGNRLLDSISAQINVPIRLISPTREAQLVFLGVTAQHAKSGEWIAADVGGGSTEVIAAEDDQLVRATSLPLGSGQFAARYLSDPPLPTELTQLRQLAGQELTQAPGRHPGQLVVTGGTTHTLINLLALEDEPRLNRTHLDEIRQLLNQQTAEQLAPLLNLEPSRIQAVRGGVEILDQLLNRYQLEELQVAREGLRQGMLRAWLAQGEDWWVEC